VNFHLFGALILPILSLFVDFRAHLMSAQLFRTDARNRAIRVIADGQCAPVRETTRAGNCWHNARSKSDGTFMQ
jgi:hypothetical protein